MRSVFFNLLHQAMKKDHRLFLVIADMGLGLVDSIEKDFPDRFLNVGIAEQNMIGVSAGLCNVGYKPFCYTISNFLIHRCFEQIRNDVCLHRYPVTLVGTSTGYDNGTLGPTHHVIDDIGCLKALPHMRIYSPTSVESSAMIFDEIAAESAPAYVRIGKGAFKSGVQGNDLNHIIYSNKGAGTLIVTHGNTVENCVKAAQIDSRFDVYSMNRIKPLDNAALDALFSKYAHVLVVEDHMSSSGLYSMLCQYVVESRINPAKLSFIAPPDHYDDKAGDKNYYAFKYGFTSEQIVQIKLD